jgi:hypothetical protein
MPDDKKLIEPIDADFDVVAKAMLTPATSLSKENKKMSSGKALTPATPKQARCQHAIMVLPGTGTNGDYIWHTKS